MNININFIGHNFLRIYDKKFYKEKEIVTPFYKFIIELVNEENRKEENGCLCKVTYLQLRDVNELHLFIWFS